MKLSAIVQNSKGQHQVTLRTGDTAHTIDVPPKSSGFDSSMNGGEALSLALATCYCNDIYREAGQRGIKVESVEVEVDGEYGPEGAPARSISYRVKVEARAGEDEIRDLMKHTDTVAEIQNTVRAGIPVPLKEIVAITKK